MKAVSVDRDGNPDGFVPEEGFIGQTEPGMPTRLLVSVRAEHDLATSGAHGMTRPASRRHNSIHIHWKLVLIIASAAFCAFGEEEKIVTEVAVHVGKITRATLHAYVTAYGTVEPEPATRDKAAAGARIASPFAGVVNEVKCYEGQQVKKGDVLFRLDSRIADVTAQSAEQIYERQKKLLGIGGTSQKVLQEAEQQLAAARAQQALLRIEAPLSGTVVRVNAKPGEAVDVNSVLAEIIDLERLVVAANVPSGEIADLKAGASVKISSAARAFAGRLIFIGSTVDSKTGGVIVRASLPVDSGFRTGQFVGVQIVSDEHKDSLAVPVESLTKNEEGKSILSIVEGGKAVQKIVKAGLREGNLVEIEAEGLKEGMQVVTTGSYGLPAGTKIRVIGD